MAKLRKSALKFLLAFIPTHEEEGWEKEEKKGGKWGTGKRARVRDQRLDEIHSRGTKVHDPSPAHLECDPRATQEPWRPECLPHRVCRCSCLGPPGTQSPTRQQRL